MSIKLMTAVWSNDSIAREDVLLLLAISDMANDAGQCWPSVTTLAQKCRCSERNVQYAIRRMEKRGLLNIQPRSGLYGTSLYTITEKALGKEPDLGLEGCKKFTPEKIAPVKPTSPGGCNPLHPRGEAHFTQTVIEPSINQEEGSVDAANAPSRQKRASRIPGDWALSEDLRAWAISQGMEAEAVEREACQFRDYWTAASGAKAAKLDWDATWRNWVRTELKRTPSRKRSADNGRFASLMAMADGIDRRAKGDGKMADRQDALGFGALLSAGD